VRRHHLSNRRKLREHKCNNLPVETRTLLHLQPEGVSARPEAVCRVWCVKHIFRRLQRSSERHRRIPRRKNLISAHLMTRVMRAVIAIETEFKRRSWKAQISLLYSFFVDTPGCYHIYYIASIVSWKEDGTGRVHSCSTTYLYRAETNISLTPLPPMPYHSCCARDTDCSRDSNAISPQSAHVLNGS
jgi:hypothetical protein